MICVAADAVRALALSLEWVVARPVPPAASVEALIIRN